MNKPMYPASFIQQAFDSRKNYIVIGLCGKTGAGCTTAAQILHASCEDLHMKQYQAQGTSFDAAYEQREYQILRRYAEQNWIPFEIVKSSALLTGHVLQYAPEMFADFLCNIARTQTVTENKGNYFRLCQQFFEKAMYLNLSPYAATDIQHLFSGTADASAVAEQVLGTLQRYDLVHPEDLAFQDSIEIDGITLFSVPNTGWIRISNVDLYHLFARFCKHQKNKENLNTPICCFILKEYIYHYLPEWCTTLWDSADQLCQISSIAKQLLGINLRLFREPYGIDTMESTVNGYTIIAEDIDFSIKLLRKYQRLAGALLGKMPHTQVIIDSIKTPFESWYLSDHYSNYYLFGICTRKENRGSRYVASGKSLEQFQALNMLEQPLELENQLQRFHAENSQGDANTLSEYILHRLYSYKKRYAKSLDNAQMHLESILQDVSSCIEIADIFINNDDASISMESNLVRYVCLIMHPGLVLPTPVERTMQIAYMAKLNSGCLSRQVGAVITDAQYHLLSMGWNQQPEGQFPCAYRDIDSICFPDDEESCKLMYSDFELAGDFKNTLHHIRHTYELDENGTGILTHFCFKDVYNTMCGERNFMYARSMHAEEIAFLNLGANANAAKGGYLFTTSSPCIACAKQAMQMQISKIYYIEQYPGIQFKHILASGTPFKYPEMMLPTGAIGKAYIQLYTPIIPLKDEDEIRTGWKMAEPLT